MPEPNAADRWQAILDAPMEELELGVRAYNMLKRRGYDTCGQVLRLDLNDAATWENGENRLGLTALQEIREAQAGLASMRLQLQAEDAAEHGDSEPEPGLSEEEKLTVLHAATSRLLDLLADDGDVRRLSISHPDEVTRTFLAGCQAGADSAIRVIDLNMRGRS